MILNILEDFVLAIFIVCSALILIKERNTRLGIIVSEDAQKITNGKQGIQTSIGRSSSSDVKLREKSISRLHAIVKYNAKTKNFDMTEYGSIGSCSNGYHIGGHNLNFMLPIEERCFEFGFIPLLFSLLFIILQSFFAINEFNSISVVIPHLILVSYLIASYFLRADRQAITEGVFSVLLTYYIEATFYGGESLTDGVKSACLGVALYTILAFAMHLFLKIDMDNYNIHSILRIFASIGILILIIMNLALARETNGAYNWIKIGSITFQPSEIVKLLLAFVLIIPSGKHGTKTNTLLMLGISILCFVYGFVIKDIGALLQFGIIFVVAVLLQNHNILYSILMIVAGIAGCKGVLLLSSTASSRIDGWLGESTNLFESLTASGIFDNPNSYGYQPIHALVAAFKNGGVFGNQTFDVMKGIEATNSDLVMSLIAQKHGFLTLYFLLGLYLILIINTLLTMRQKNKVQQVFACIGIALMIFAMGMNLCGTFGLVALTGVVSPALSDGISSAISYGSILGVISSSAMSKEYLKTIKEGEKNYEY